MKKLMELLAVQGKSSQSVLTELIKKTKKQTETEDYSSDDQDKELDIEEIFKMQLNLKTCGKAYQQISEYINTFAGANVVLAFGFTGSGKSTLLNSLVQGPESLKFKKVKRRLTIQSKEEGSPFKIGHNLSKAETFFPKFEKDPEQENVYYVDIAGLDDWRGDKIEILNCLILK